MKVPADWLGEFVPSLPPAAELAEGLTMRGLEVESVERAGPDLPGVLAGVVRECEPLAGGGPLMSCLVGVGRRKRPLRIVCGAPNVSAGTRVAVATVGSRLGGREVSAREVRGTVSEGIICSERELGLGEDHGGALVLDAGTEEGAALGAALRLDAPVLDVAVTPNRGDCLSVLGVGREVRAMTGARPGSFRSRFVPDIGEEHEALIADDAAQACPLYGCVVIRGVAGPAAPSPLWMRDRLRRCGVRSIGRAVDVTNYFMMGYGQPLHAFDLGRLDGAIRVRFARPGERLRLLDEQTVDLSGDTLVIADGKGAVAIGGVMGGADSGVGEGTTDILLEGAFFSPSHVRGKTRAYNLGSEAAFRFERGVDPTLPSRVLGPAARKITELCGGKAGPVSIARKGELPSRAPIGFDTGSVERILGLARTPAQVRRALARMGFRVEPGGGKRLVVTPPAFRFDMSIPEDLVEEVARDHGYGNIPVTFPETEGRMLADARTGHDPARVCRALAGRGYQEVVTYAFVPEDWERGLHGNPDPVRLANPISDEATVMRSSLVGGLVDRARHNRNRRQARLQLAEVGRCFPSQAAVEGGQPVKVAGLRYGADVPEQWGATPRETDFFDIKGDVESLLPGPATEFRPCADHPALHPGKCAKVLVGGETAGHVGALHPRWARDFELPASTHVFELLFAPVSRLAGGSLLPSLGRMSRLPHVWRDLSVVLGLDVPAGDVLRVAKGMEGKGGLRLVELFDCYVPEDGEERRVKRLGIRMTLQGADSNLEERDIAAVVDRMERLLADAFGARRAGKTEG